MSELLGFSGVPEEWIVSGIPGLSWAGTLLGQTTFPWHQQAPAAWGEKCLKPDNYGIMYSKRVPRLSVPELEGLYPLPDPCKTWLNSDVLVIRSSMVPGAGASCRSDPQGLGAEQEGGKKPCGFF